MFNAQLFGQLNNLTTNNCYQNICLVPSWKLWQWPAIRRWKEPGQASQSLQEKNIEQKPAKSAKEESCISAEGGKTNSPSRTSRASVQISSSRPDASGQPSTIYLPVFYLPVVGRSVNDVFYAWALSKWAKTINSGDVVYSPWLYPDGVAVERVLRGRGARVWLMALGSDTLRLQESRCRRKIIEACSAAEGIVCVAQVLADRLAAAGVPREKLHVVPNGVDASLFRVRGKKELSSCSVVELMKWGGSEEIGLNNLTTDQLSNLKLILFIGNLVPIKGPDILLKAFAKLLEIQKSGEEKNSNMDEQDRQDRGVEVLPQSSCKSCLSMFKSIGSGHCRPSLVVIGSGSLRAKLERLARDLGISDRVHFLGNRSHLEVARWMNVADVLCLASRNEGMPNVVLEARASGLPVVATPAGAIPELPLDKEHFLVVKSCNSEDLAAGLQEMLGRDLSNRKPDPAISTWGGMAERVLGLIQEKAGLSV